MWKYANVADPYGVYPDGEECIGRVYFARPSGSDVWVCFGDLPDATVKALREKQEFRRAFPEPTVYRRAEELLIVGEDHEQFVRVRIEQASKLIEKMDAALRHTGPVRRHRSRARGRRTKRQPNERRNPVITLRKATIARGEQRTHLRLTQSNRWQSDWPR